MIFQQIAIVIHAVAVTGAIEQVSVTARAKEGGGTSLDQCQPELFRLVPVTVMPGTQVVVLITLPGIVLTSVVRKISPR